MQPDLNAPTQQAQANMGELKNIFAGQRNETSDFLNRYTNTINNQETMSGMAKRIGGELGLPTLQSNANMLRTTLNQLPTTYSKATTGYDVNANQLSRIIGQKSSELAPAVDTAERALETAENNLTTRLGYGQADQQKQLLPFQSEQSLLSDRLARETSGFTAAMGQELDAIIAKMNAGVTISEGEKNRAQQLAIAEKQFEQQKQLQQMQGPNTQIVDSGGKKLLINSGTGQVISSYAGAPKTAAATPNLSAYLSSPSPTWGASSSAPPYFKPAK